MNEYYDLGQQFEYHSGCEEFEKIDLELGSLILWKLCVDNFNLTNNSRIILEDEEGIIKVDFINEQNDLYDTIFNVNHIHEIIHG